MKTCTNCGRTTVHDWQSKCQFCGAALAHETPRHLPLQAAPTAVGSGPRFSLAFLGVAAMAFVAFLSIVILTSNRYTTLRWSWNALLFIYAYPVYISDVAPGYLLFGFAYLVPFIVAFRLPASMNRIRARTLVVLSGCVAGLVYFMGFVLSAWYFG
jgi:hypothetical protein